MQTVKQTEHIAPLLACVTAHDSPHECVSVSSSTLPFYCPTEFRNTERNIGFIGHVCFHHHYCTFHYCFLVIITVFFLLLIIIIIIIIIVVIITVLLILS